MQARFEVPAHDLPFNPRRLWFLPILCLGAAVLEEGCLSAPGVGWRGPSALMPLLRTAAWYFECIVALSWISLRRSLVAVEVEPGSIRVHSALQSLPVIGGWIRPATFRRPDWRLAATRRGLLVGRASSDPGFRWGAERIFSCPERARPALDRWLATQMPAE